MKAARVAAERGYTNIMLFREGIPAWVAAGYPLETGKALPKAEIPTLTPEQLQQKLGEYQVVDIRDASLWEEMGGIKGSLKIPLGLLSQRYSEIPKDKKVMLVDHTGKQVLAAGRFLKNQAYTDVSRLQGGMVAWTDAKLPVEK
jgi:rhodanese-related sulfurtransferase